MIAYNNLFKNIENLSQEEALTVEAEAMPAYLLHRQLRIQIKCLPPEEALVKASISNKFKQDELSLLTRYASKGAV